jgi:hypothetical protein
MVSAPVAIMAPTARRWTPSHRKSVSENAAPNICRQPTNKRTSAQCRFSGKDKPWYIRMCEYMFMRMHVQGQKIELGGTAAAGPSALRGTFGVFPQFRHIVETPLQAPEQMLMKGGFCVRELVVVPLPVLASHDEPSAAQIREMT